MTTLLFESGIWQDTESVFRYNSGTVVAIKANVQSLLLNTLFESNASPGDSGAYHGSESLLECTGCVFRNNTAAVGSELVIEQFSPTTLRNCLFERNTARNQASTISAQGTISSPTYIYNTVFRLNESPKVMLLLFNAKLHLESVLIEHNTASEDSPCILALHSTFTANNVTFRYQTGKETAFVAIQSGCTVTIANSRIYEGFAVYSGAITLSGSSLSVVNSTLYALTGSNSAILWTQGVNIILFDSVSAYNLHSESIGSIISTSLSILTITNCLFSDFTQGALAGANLVSLIIRNTVFARGIAAALTCDMCKHVEIHYSRFEYLNAALGGAMMLTACTDVVISHAALVNNAAGAGEEFMLRTQYCSFQTLPSMKISK